MKACETPAALLCRGGIAMAQINHMCPKKLQKRYKLYIAGKSNKDASKFWDDDWSIRAISTMHFLNLLVLYGVAGVCSLFRKLRTKHNEYMPTHTSYTYRQFGNSSLLFLDCGE